MAAANLIAQLFERMDSLRRELSVMRWMMGIGFGILIAVVTAALFGG